MLEKLIELLGEDNTDRLKVGIVELILNRIEIDFENSGEWVLNPDDVAELAESCKEKAFKNIENELVQKLEIHMRKSLSLVNDNVEHLPSTVVDFGIEAMGGFYVKYENGATKLLSGKQVIDKLNGK